MKNTKFDDVMMLFCEDIDLSVILGHARAIDWRVTSKRFDKSKIRFSRFGWLTMEMMCTKFREIPSNGLRVGG